MHELLKRERGLAWTAHARIKGSHGFPDRHRHEPFFLSDRFQGAAWKAMPADLSREKTGERVLDLLDAFARIRHPRKSLTFVGVVSADISRLLERHSCPAEVKFLGRWPQVRLREIMSRSHVMALPSIQEGMAMVQAQAMACGCPVIASEHTGAADLFTDGTEGFIVPIRSPETIGERLQELADDPVRREAMSRAALTRVRSLGGWQDYGERMSIVLKGICEISCA